MPQRRDATAAGSGPLVPRVSRARPGWPLSRRWTVVVVLLAVVFAVLRVVHAAAPAPDPVALPADRVVLVGVTGRYQLDEVDRAVLAADPGRVQAGAVSVRARVIGDCAAAGWLTLGSGRRAGLQGRCDPAVERAPTPGGDRVADWAGWLAAASAERGDARPGTLAALAPGCVAAVGPGAALAAARSDGTLASYASAAEFLAAGARSACPTTLVDPGADADAVVRALAAQPDVTLLVTGIGPAAGSSDPGLQAVYLRGPGPAGWLTSGSTRREGVVTLADLTRTLLSARPVPADPVAAANGTDGAPLQLDPAALDVAAVEHHLRSVAALSSAAVTGYLAVAGGGALLVLALLGGLLLRRPRGVHLVCTLGCVLAAAMVLPGVVPWWTLARPGLVVSLLVLGWAVVLTAAALVLARRLRVPAAVAGAGLTVAVLTADAALGGVLQPGSLLNSRPVAGGRWYGFGNVIFAVYATAGLVLAGHVAGRFLQAGRRPAAVVAAAVVGCGVVLCEGWPSMGTDFGGVISLTPGLVWLLLVLSGTRLTLPRLLGAGAVAVLAVAAISLLDWRRGPGARSHLGNFVQRVLDGDALDIVSRKAVVALDTLVSPVGVGAVLLGALVWVLVLRRAVPVLADGLPTLRPVAVAVLVTAVLGTLLNDGGVYVWLTATASAALVVGALLTERPAAGPVPGAGREVGQGSRSR